ncbi:MAG: DUF4179 domain-containing protein [Sarcina sp.]
MKNEFDKLNEIENDIDIEEIEISEEEKERVRKRVMKKVEGPKNKSKKKMVMAASLCLALGGSFALTNETVIASVERMGRSLETFFGVDQADKEIVDYKDYKNEILKEVEDKGIKFSVNEVILDGKDFYISTTVDYSKFDLSTLKESWDGDYSVIVEKIEDKFTVNGKVMEEGSLGASYEYNKDLKTVDILFDFSPEDIETSDGIYDISLKIPEMTFQKYTKGGEYEKIDGNWNVDFEVDGNKLAQEIETIEVNKDMKINKDDKVATIKVTDIKKSPVSILVEYEIDKGMYEFNDGVEDDENYNIEFEFYDGNNKKIDFRGQGGSGTLDVYKGSEKWMIDRDIITIKIVPVIRYYKNGNHVPIKDKVFKDQAIEMNIE